MIKQLLDSHKYLICAGIGTFSLLLNTISIISISKSVKELSTKLEPISIWAETQNECVTKTYRINGKNTKGIADKVWSCNGGGD